MKDTLFGSVPACLFLALVLVCGTANSQNQMGGITQPINGTTPSGVMTGTTSNTDAAGELTLSGGMATYTFTKTYQSHPICTANSESSNSPVRIVYNGVTSVSFMGTGADLISYTCIART